MVRLPNGKWTPVYNFELNDPGAYSGLYHALNKDGHATIVSSVEESLEDTIKDATLVVLGGKIVIDDHEFLDFIKSGNDVVLISEQVDYDTYYYYNSDSLDHSILDDFFNSIIYMSTDECLSIRDTSSVAIETMNFCHMKNTLHKSYVTMRYIDFNEGPTMLYDANSNQPLVQRLKLGEGTVTLHPNTWLLNNISFADADFPRYFNMIFGPLNSESIILTNDYNIGDVYEGRPSKLQYILDNDGLSHAYWTLIILGLIYLFFQSKRVVRPVRVLLDEENTSVDFSRTISEVYLHHNDNLSIAKMMRDHFYHHVDTHYYIDRSHNQWINRLVMKSGIDQKHLLQISNQLAALSRKNNIEDSELIALNATLNFYYKNCI